MTKDIPPPTLTKRQQAAATFKFCFTWFESARPLETIPVQGRSCGPSGAGPNAEVPGPGRGNDCSKRGAGQIAGPGGGSGVSGWRHRQGREQGAEAGFTIYRT